MSTTLSKEIMGVREFLGAPLPQSPTTRQILSEMETEYSFITNRLNDREDAWAVDEFIITTVANQSRYRVDILYPKFYKALNVVSIPTNSSNLSAGDGYELGVDLDFSVYSGDSYEEPLNLVQLENAHMEWNSLAPESGQLFGNSASSMFVSFFRTVLKEQGEAIFLEIRPVPKEEGQKYKVLYQLTDWWDTLFGDFTHGSANKYLAQKLPNSSQKMYLRALVAKNLVLKGQVKWALNYDRNMDRAKGVLASLDDKISRYGASFNSYIDGLNAGEIVDLVGYSEDTGL